MPPLSDFPPEIWAQILDFACMEDGTTARSLSLASRQFRHLSRNHLYYAVKVDGVPQLLRLDDQISQLVPVSMQGSGYCMKTRFLSITLPTPFNLDAYTEESYAPYLIPGDTPYRPKEDDADSDGSSYGTDFSDDTESVNDEAISHNEKKEQSLQEELEAELAGITNDPGSSGDNLGPGHTIDSLSDLLANPHYSADLYTHSVYTSLRRLLDACANTLEVFSLYFNPWKFIPLELFIPALPKFKRLSIYIRQSQPRMDARTLASPSLRFPSLTTLRVVDSFFADPRLNWWDDVIKSCPPNVQVIIGAKDLTTEDWTSALKEEDGVNYQMLTARTTEGIVCRCRGSDIAVQWWLDDIAGSNTVLDTADANKVGDIYPDLIPNEDENSDAMQTEDTEDDNSEF
ncbi:hypothetical protein MD484_g1353, partial [Candolleomyces efflorescens]